MKASDLSTPDRVVLLFSLVPYLREHGPTPLAELAQAFAVDQRLLRSLISFLGMAGIPGETATYQDEDLFDIDWAALEESDVVSLTRTVAVEDTPRFTSTESAALLAGMVSLRPMLPEAQHSMVDTLLEKLRVASVSVSNEAVVSVSAEKVAPKLPLVTEALSGRSQLTFDYFDARGRRSNRVVDPLSVRQQNGHWYLRAWCYNRQAPRTFDLDRMIDLTVSALPVTHSAEQFSADDAHFFTAAVLSEELQGITTYLSVTEQGWAAIAGFAPVRDDAAAASNGWFPVTVELAHPAVAVRLVQAKPGHVRVCGPAQVQSAVSEWAQLALVGYDI